MEVDMGDSLEEHLRLAGVPPDWGELDLSQLQSPPAPSPPRTATRRSRRRLSGIQPCSSHRMTLRRRSGVAPLSPVERSLDALQLGDGEPEESRLTPSPAPVPTDASPPLPPPQQPQSQTQTTEEPASARRTGRRRSLVPLNAPLAPTSGRKSRRRSFGGQSVAERTGGDLIDLAEMVDGTGKENGWLGVGEPHSPTQTGLKRNLAAFEADSLAVGAEQWRSQSSTADGSAAEVTPGPGEDHRDGSGAGMARAAAEAGMSEVKDTVPDSAPMADKPRRPAARGRQRRRSAGGALMAPVETVTPRESADVPTDSRTSLTFTTAPAAISAEQDMDTVVEVTISAATAATPTTAAPSASSTRPEETDFRLPPELEEYYTNRNYEPPVESRLSTIVEEEAPEPARLVRASRLRCTDLGKVRKCTMELTPAKQRLRKLKAQRVKSMNKARSRKGRPTGLKTKKLLDARLKELDLFHREEEARAAREKVEETASAVAEAAAGTAAGATESQDTVKQEEEPMDVEPDPPALPSCGLPCGPPPTADQTPPRSPRSSPVHSPLPPSPPPCEPLVTLPAPLPDLDATWTGSPARACLTPRIAPDGPADSTLSSSSADLVLELTRSSADSSLSDGPAMTGTGASPVIVGGGELNLDALRDQAGFSDGEESTSPCLGGRLNRAVLLSPDDRSA